jgi:uncharacterized protein YbjT (DUF2867 family)
MSKLIVVVGATGGQGGSVAKYFLSDPEYIVRGVTRNPEGQKAHDLKALGVEIVKADVGDVESLEKAFEGAYAIFAVTDYYETFFAKGKNSRHRDRVPEWVQLGESGFQDSHLAPVPVEHSPPHQQVEPG